jgi:hypothetical protein
MTTIIYTAIITNMYTYDNCNNEDKKEYEKKIYEMRQVLKCNIEKLSAITDNLKIKYNGYTAQLIKCKTIDLLNYLEYSIKFKKQSFYILEWLKTLHQLVKLYNKDIISLINKNK